MKQTIFEKDDTSYEAIIKTIDNAPTTQLPGLLSHIIKTCIIKNVFNPGGLITAVNTILVLYQKNKKCHPKTQ